MTDFIWKFGGIETQRWKILRFPRFHEKEKWQSVSRRHFSQKNSIAFSIPPLAALQWNNILLEYFLMPKLWNKCCFAKIDVYAIKLLEEYENQCSASSNHFSLRTWTWRRSQIPESCPAWLNTSSSRFLRRGDMGPDVNIAVAFLLLMAFQLNGSGMCCSTFSSVGTNHWTYLYPNWEWYISRKKDISAVNTW